jgi:hypothetical protein
MNGQLEDMAVTGCIQKSGHKVDCEENRMPDNNRNLNLWK